MWASQFLASTLVQTTPILLAALGTMVTSRANMLNVAIEGMALVAAFAAIAVGQAENSAVLGFASAIAASVAMALMFGFVSIVLGADFIVAGLGLNILASGGTLFLLEEVYQNPGGLRPDVFPDLWRVPAGLLTGCRLLVRRSKARVSLCSWRWRRSRSAHFFSIARRSATRCARWERTNPRRLRQAFTPHE